MDRISTISQEIHKTYVERLDCTKDLINVILRYGNHCNVENGWEDTYRAALFYDGKRIAATESLISFQDAIDKLAKQLEVI